MLNCSLNHARSGPHSCSASTAPLVGSISPPPTALWLAPIFIVFHGPQAHVNSCGNRPVRRANLQLVYSGHMGDSSFREDSAY
jgi:hypothetical protein